MRIWTLPLFIAIVLIPPQAARAESGAADGQLGWDQAAAQAAQLSGNLHRAFISMGSPGGYDACMNKARKRFSEERNKTGGFFGWGWPMLANDYYDQSVSISCSDYKPYSYERRTSHCGELYVFGHDTGYQSCDEYDSTEHHGDAKKYAQCQSEQEQEVRELFQNKDGSWKLDELETSLLRLAKVTCNPLP